MENDNEPGPGFLAKAYFLPKDAITYHPDSLKVTEEGIEVDKEKEIFFFVDHSQQIEVDLNKQPEETKGFQFTIPLRK